MIDLYYWGTPNGHKITIALEEMGLEYQIFPINILENDQFQPDFLKISPNNKIPAIVDQIGPRGEPISVFESGAILCNIWVEKQVCSIRLMSKNGLRWNNGYRGKWADLAQC